MRDCDDLPLEFRGKSVAEIPALAARLEELSRDLEQWVRVFRCRQCGQLWEERYEATGHGEIATTRKIPGDGASG
jgi:hypothetical protein